MSWIRVWIHLVFSTKNRIPYLDSHSLRFKVFEHIKENAKEKDIWLDCVGGYTDHAHCLVSLGTTQTISNTAKLIKGESSFWINKNQLVKGKFSWQDDFWAVSVSESHVKAVRNYIHQQEEKHGTIPFSLEIDEFMKKYDWKIIKGS